MNKLLLGILFGLIYSKNILPKEHNNNPKICFTLNSFLYKSMIIIPISKKKALHIHHWFIYSIILLYSLFFKISDIIKGFSFILIIQGLLYKDCMHFICKNPY